MRIFICRDNIPCICLGQWDLSADYFEDEMLSGMIPVLFAENPSEAEKGLMKDLISARKDLDRINRAFFIPEAVDLENALKVIKKPRLGEAEYKFFVCIFLQSNALHINLRDASVHESHIPKQQHPQGSESS